MIQFIFDMFLMGWKVVFQTKLKRTLPETKSKHPNKNQ